MSGPSSLELLFELDELLLLELFELLLLELLELLLFELDELLLFELDELLLLELLELLLELLLLLFELEFELPRARRRSRGPSSMASFAGAAVSAASVERTAGADSAFAVLSGHAAWALPAANAPATMMVSLLFMTQLLSRRFNILACAPAYAECAPGTQPLTKSARFGCVRRVEYRIESPS